MVTVDLRRLCFSESPLTAWPNSQAKCQLLCSDVITSFSDSSCTIGPTQLSPFQRLVIPVGSSRGRSKFFWLGHSPDLDKIFDRPIEAYIFHRDVWVALVDPHQGCIMTLLSVLALSFRAKAMSPAHRLVCRVVDREVTDDGGGGGGGCVPQ